MNGKILSAVMVALIGVSTDALAEVDSMTTNDFFFFFESVHLVDGCLTLTRSNQDIGLKFKMGPKPAVDSPPESAVRIPPGAPCRWFNDDRTLWLTPAYACQGSKYVWLLEEVNRRGDLHACIRRQRRYLEMFPKPSEGFEIEPVQADDRASLRRLEVECTGSQIVAGSGENK